MFQAQQQDVEIRIRAYCQDTGLPEPATIPWNAIPFAGEWGISTSFFQLAAQEARTRKRKNRAEHQRRPARAGDRQRNGCRPGTAAGLCAG